MYVKAVFLIFGAGFGGVFGFAAGGSLAAIFTSGLTSGSMVGATGFIIFAECLGALAGGWLGVWLSFKLLAALPSFLKERSRLACTLFLVVETILCLCTLPSAVELFAGAATTMGKVKEALPKDHGNVTYTYEIDGQVFEQRGNPEGITDLQPGTPVKVYYVPYKPGLSGLQEPRDALLRTFTSTLYLSAFASIWLFLIAAMVLGERGGFPNLHIRGYPAPAKPPN